MRLALQIHAARMRLRTAQERLRELELKAPPRGDPERLKVFRQFWQEVDRDYSLLKMEKTRRSLHIPLTKEAFDRLRGVVEQVMEAR